MKNIVTLLWRGIREGTLQLWRNRFLSGTTLLFGALIILLLNFLFGIRFFADEVLHNLESRADFSVPLRPDYDPFELQALQNDLTNAATLELHLLPSEDFGDFVIPERLYIRFGELSDVKVAMETIKKPRYDLVVGDWDIEAERDFVTLVERLLQLRDGVETAGFWLTLLFALGGGLLAVNTFRMVLFSRRDEIYIARLVGADSIFIIWPYMWEGFLLGALSSLGGIIGFIFVLREIPVLPGGDIFVHLWDHVFGVQLLCAGTVGAFGAYIALRRHLGGTFEYRG